MRTLQRESVVSVPSPPSTSLFLLLLSAVAGLAGLDEAGLFTMTEDPGNAAAALIGQP